MGPLLRVGSKETLIDPQFTFNFIGFEWLQPLPGLGMYLYFIAMGTLGICIALGYKYRLSTAAFRAALDRRLSYAKNSL